MTLSDSFHDDPDYNFTLMSDCTCEMMALLISFPSKGLSLSLREYVIRVPNYTKNVLFARDIFITANFKTLRRTCKHFTTFTV